MEKIIVTQLDQLFKECNGRTVYIYGAKTVALRTEYFLKSKNIETRAFIVSNKHDNPKTINNKQVLRIEDNSDIAFDCIVIAVGSKYVWDVENEMQNYNIDKLIIIHPVMDDDFHGIQIISKGSKISEKSYISKNAQIVVDETSTITIDDNATIKSGVIILVSNHSNVYLSNGVVINRNTQLIVDNKSKLSMETNSVIYNDGNISAINKSKLFMGTNSVIYNEGNISAINNSIIEIGSEMCIGSYIFMHSCYSSIIDLNGKCIGNYGRLESTNNSVVLICKQATINSHAFISSDNSNIEIGEDAMISYYVKIAVGHHNLFDVDSRQEITNYNPIIIGDHTWIGMGAIILPGAIIHNGSVVGAGSVVNKEIAPCSVCAGNPAKIIRNNVKWNRDNANFE